MTTETFGISPNIQPSYTPADLVAFFHAALFSPISSTLLRAMKKGFLLPFAGLTESNLKRYPPPAEATAMGHMDSKHKHIQSTKKLTSVSTPDCRGVLILDSGLIESHEYGPGTSQLCDICPARELAHQAKVAVSDSLQAHITVRNNCKAIYGLSLVDSNLTLSQVIFSTYLFKILSAGPKMVDSIT
jgi:hypothetical protein